MYSVSAPANACDTQENRNSDQPAKQAATRDLKLVHGPQSENDFQKNLQNIDAGELAAKILQLHAAADEKAAGEPRTPKLIDDQTDDRFEMPSALQKDEVAQEQADSDVNPAVQAKSALPYPSSDAHGPNLKYLLLSTLLIGLAAGAVLAMTLPGMLTSDEAQSRAVETEAITADPVTASAVGLQPAAINSAQDTQSGTATPSGGPVATPEQIAKAKASIQKALAVGSTGTAATVTLADPIRNEPITPTVAVAEEAVDAPRPSFTPTPDIPAFPVLASTAASVALPETDPEPAQSDSLGASIPTEPEITPAVTEDAVTPPVAEESPDATNGFPNEGKTTAAVNLRLTEERNGKIIAVIPKNTVVSYNECGLWWCGVTYEGQNGFVGKTYVDRTVP